MPASPARALDRPRVAGRALLDPRLQQGQEQVRLAVELRVDDAGGEARLVGDLIHRSAVIAALQEHLAGSRQQQRAVAFGLLGPGQSR